MEQEKQIEEMAEILEAAKINALATIGSLNDGFGMWYATALYNVGYRKQSVGEWVDKYHGKYANQVYKCSVCGDTAHSDGRGHWFLTPYCHNCGAKMGGGAE